MSNRASTSTTDAIVIVEHPESPSTQQQKASTPENYVKPGDSFVDKPNTPDSAEDSVKPPFVVQETKNSENALTGPGCEDVDGLDFKGMELDVANVIVGMDTLNLHHSQKKTGMKMPPTSIGQDCRPDITGYAQSGTQFVVDTKYYGENTYVSKKDIVKVKRDSDALKEITGQDSVPIIVNSGNVSKKSQDLMEQAGVKHISVPYPNAGWETDLKDQLEEIL